MTIAETVLRYDCVQSRQCADEWLVEAIDHASEGEIYGAAFSGPGAKERADEYARWRNGELELRRSTVSIREVMQLSRDIFMAEAAVTRLIAEREELEVKIRDMRERAESLRATLEEQIAGERPAIPRLPRAALTASAGESGSVIQRMRSVFAEAPGVELTAEAVHARLTGDAADLSTVRSTLVRLHQAAYLVRPRRGAYMLASTEPPDGIQADD